MQDDVLGTKPPFAAYAWRTAAVVTSIVVWLVYDLIVLVVAGFTAAEHEIPRSDWAIVAGAAAAPLLPVVLVASWRSLRGNLLPANTFGRLMVAVQALGIAGLGAAVMIPIVFHWPYSSTGAKISVDNRTQYTYVIWVDDDSYCGANGWVEQHTTATITFWFSDALGGCPGHKPGQIKLLSALGTWQCDWADAKAHEPLVITDDGPSCAATSYTPGILRQPTTTGGPPFSPPSR
jgi:hypothetical protein